MANIKNRRLFTSYISITIIMSVVLFLFGFFGIFFISSNSIANSFKENFSVSIFFKEDAKNIEITQLQNEILMSDYVEKLKYVSKDEAVLLMKEEYGQDFIKELGFNPLVNSIDFNLKSEYVEATLLDSISRLIENKNYIDEIKNLPVNDISAEQSHLYLWTTNPFLQEGLDVCKAWGFEYKTLITWLKTYQDGTPVMGMGYYFRGCTEHIIFGVKGKKLCENNETRNIIIDRATKHSEKPIDVKKIIVECSGDLPRIELFSRPKYDLLYDETNNGWDVWGNEV